MNSIEARWFEMAVEEFVRWASPVMTFRCPMLQNREFENAVFRLSLMRKDMMLVLSESQKLGVPMPVWTARLDLTLPPA